MWGWGVFKKVNKVFGHSQKQEKPKLHQIEKVQETDPHKTTQNNYLIDRASLKELNNSYFFPIDVHKIFKIMPSIILNTKFNPFWIIFITFRVGGLTFFQSSLPWQVGLIIFIVYLCHYHNNHQNNPNQQLYCHYSHHYHHHHHHGCHLKNCQNIIH